MVETRIRPGVGERIARDWPLWLGALVVFAVALRYAMLSPGTYQDDDVDHYFLTEDPARARTTMAMVADEIRGAARPARA